MIVIHSSRHINFNILGAKYSCDVHKELKFSVLAKHVVRFEQLVISFYSIIFLLIC